MKRIGIVIGLFSLVAALALLRVFFGPSPPVADQVAVSIREEPMERIERSEGALRVSGELEPFDGYMIERYPDGVMKTRSRVVAGTLHGLVEGWYTNGVKQIEEPFVEGVSHGTRKRWHPDGTLAASTQIEHGELHGVFRRWDENGKLVEHIHMAHGKPDGKSIAFYPSGYVRSRVTMRNGEMVEQEQWNDLVMKTEM